VEHRDDREALALVEIHQQLHDLHLVAQIEVHGGLVEDEQLSLLGEGHRDEHQLPLAQGQLARIPAAQVADSRALHGGVHGRDIREPRA